VGSVVPGSPAAAAGISAGDTVTRIDGEPVRTIADLRTQIYPDPPGTEVELTVVRSGRTYTVPVVMTSPPGGAS
jgi:S1-C subfamily serine protease